LSIKGSTETLKLHFSLKKLHLFTTEFIPKTFTWR